MELTSILHWLKANKEWLLSGIGIFVISTLAVMLRSIGYRIWKELIYFRSFDVYISTPVVSLVHQNDFKRHKKTIEELEIQELTNMVESYKRRVESLQWPVDLLTKGFPEIGVCPAIEKGYSKSCLYDLLG